MQHSLNQSHVQSKPVSPGSTVRSVPLDKVRNEDPLSPLYVLNTTHLKSPRGAIVTIGISRGPGQDALIVRVPNTWLAEDLTLQGPREDILNATRFLEALRANLITIISAEDAARINNSEKAQEERNRLAWRAKQRDQANQSRGQGRSGLGNSFTIVGREDEAPAYQTPQVVQASQRVPMPQLASPVAGAGNSPFIPLGQMTSEVDLSEHMDAILNGVEEATNITPEFEQFIAQCNSMTEANARRTVAGRRKISLVEMDAMIANLTHRGLVDSLRTIRQSMEPDSL